MTPRIALPNYPCYTPTVEPKEAVMDYIATAIEMRQKAWAEIVASSAFRAFRACDNMVVELGGASVMPPITTIRPDITPPVPEPTNQSGATTPRIRVRARDGTLRPTQAEAAFAVLTELGPMGTKDVMDFSVEKGAAAGGLDPLMNFRTTLSKDDRFYSFRHNGEHYWWLTGQTLPEGWDEAAVDLLRDAASSSDSQKGGDGHGPATT
jgi:hypothetical protein